jgi:hypothetical protein
MRSDLYFKFYLTERQTVINTCIYLNLSETALKYLVASWVYVTSKRTKENLFCANDLIPIVKLINPGYKYEHKSLKNDVMDILEQTGYIKVAYQEQHPGSPKKFYELVYDKIYEFFNISLVFHQEYVKRYKIKGPFGVIPKLKQYPKIKRDVLQHIKSLKGL